MGKSGTGLQILRAVYFFHFVVHYWFSGLGAGAKQDGQLESYYRGEMAMMLRAGQRKWLGRKGDGFCRGKQREASKMTGCQVSILSDQVAGTEMEKTAAGAGRSEIPRWLEH